MTSSSANRIKSAVFHSTSWPMKINNSNIFLLHKKREKKKTIYIFCEVLPKKLVRIKVATYYGSRCYVPHVNFDGTAIFVRIKEVFLSTRDL
jgi:hypothetical protein